MSAWTFDQIPDLQGRHAVVTGANSGLGYWTALHLARRGAHVVLACRSRARADEAAERIVTASAGAHVGVMELDVADLDSVKAFAAHYAEQHHQLHVLCNNAGLALPPLSHTRHGFEAQFGTNFLGHFALTGHLLPILRATPGARVVHTASIAHRFGRIDFDDPHFRSRPYRDMAAYGQSKLANLMFAFELQRRLTRAGIDALSIAAHPGYAATNISASNKLGSTRVGQAMVRLGDRLLGQTAEAGARPILLAATSMQARGGDYWGPRGLMEMRGAPRRVGSTRAARDEAAAARLWTMAENLTDVRYLS
ncbi:MAG: putative Protochlorophyllide reductase [Panacagrimonas sp.]|jgi:NAD(P)-dependent dehydrogenase (short-subunit alcohol dehydrogenase family)|nr:oxidoreductase [Panacagrimonas sp.]MCC2655837.1 putative Protochlorophyllide reductase [Panacagrimonas sp.]